MQDCKLSKKKRPAPDFRVIGYIIYWICPFMPLLRTIQNLFYGMIQFHLEVTHTPDGKNNHDWNILLLMYVRLYRHYCQWTMVGVDYDYYVS